MSQSQLILTDADKKNLVSLLNRVQTTGLEEAQLLLTYANAIKNAPAHTKTPEDQGTPPGDE